MRRLRPCGIGLYGIRFTLNECGSSRATSRARMLDAIVDAGEHHVLDEHLAASELDVAPALGEHVVEWVAIVYRHQLRAQCRASGAWSERARRIGASTSSTNRVRPGIQPTVEIVVRRGVMPRSGRRAAAPRT